LGVLRGGPVLKTVVALALVWALAGCGGAQMPTLKTQALLDGKVQIGMSRLDVEKDLGFPQKIERVGATTFYFYVPSWYYPSYLFSSQNPVAFASERVVGFGQAYYEAVVADSDKVATPN
jgi:hypothetical protein